MNKWGFKMLINLDLIERFNPCNSRISHYMDYYGITDFTIDEFIRLEHLLESDKIWLLTRLLTDDQAAIFGLDIAFRCLELADNIAEYAAYIACYSRTSDDFNAANHAALTLLKFNPNENHETLDVLKNLLEEGSTMKKEVTNITVFFDGTEKGKQKIKQQSIHLDQRQGHITITPAAFNAYEKDAWRAIDGLGYKNVVSGNISINFGHEDDGMVFIQLLPKQKQLIAR